MGTAPPPNIEPEAGLVDVWDDGPFIFRNAGAAVDRDLLHGLPESVPVAPPKSDPVLDVAGTVVDFGFEPNKPPPEPDLVDGMEAPNHPVLDVADSVFEPNKPPVLEAVPTVRVSLVSSE